MSDGYGIPERILRIGIVLLVVFLILVGLVLLLASQSSRYLTDSRNLGRLVEQALIYATLAAGMSLVLVAGEADLSIGGMVSLVMVVVAGLVVNNDVPAVVAVVVALGLGILIGLINGVLITLLRLPFYIVTLAMLFLTVGLSLSLYEPGSSGFMLRLPGKPLEASLLLLLVLNLVVYSLGVLALFLLGRFTSLGKLVSLNARSEAESRPGDMALGFYKIGAYTMSSLLAALAGLALLNLYRTVQPGGYTDLTIVAIAAAVIGGVPLWKGSTRLLGAFLGCVALALISPVVTYIQMREGVRLSPVAVGSTLALLAAILWGLAGWVLDFAFGRRKQDSQVGDTARDT
jgi:ribose transport system permease protein